MRPVTTVRILGRRFLLKYFQEIIFRMSSLDLACNPLSAQGVRSNDYIKWKEETLANQTSHKVKTNTTLQTENTKPKAKLNCCLERMRKLVAGTSRMQTW